MLQNYAKSVVLGKAAQKINRPPAYKNDPEIQAAMKTAAESTTHHWWKREPKPEIILNDRDRAILKGVKSRAWVLDEGFHCCCFRVGLDPIVGLVPVVGDAIGLVLALELVRVAMRADLPNHIIMQMLGNVAIDFMAGLVPVLGDIGDAFLKCNKRNAVLLEEYLLIRRRDEIRMEQGLAGNTHHSIQGRKSDHLPASSNPKSLPPPSTSAVQPIGYHEHTEYDGHNEHPENSEHNRSNEHDTDEAEKKKKYGTFLGMFRS